MEASSMPTLVEKLSGEPIVVVHAQKSDANVRQEMADAVKVINEALDSQTEKVFLIVNMTGITMALDDIIQGAGMSARGQRAMLHHPNVRESMYVVTDRMMKMAVKGLNSATFGQVKAQVFDTVEDAVSYCRGQIGEPGYQ
jgi:hypothetical protein